MAARITPIEKPTLIISSENPDREELRKFVMAMLKAVDAAQKKQAKQRARLGLPPLKESAPPEGNPDDPNYGIEPFQPAFNEMKARMLEDQAESAGVTIDPANDKALRRGYRVSTGIGQKVRYRKSLSKKRVQEIYTAFCEDNRPILKHRDTCVRSYTERGEVGVFEVAQFTASHAEAQALCRQHGLRTYWGLREKWAFRAEGEDRVET